MAGVRLETAELGWHGVVGDRRFAFRRLGDHRPGFPWLTASRLPALLLFTPFVRDGADGPVPTHVRTPEGQELEIGSRELAEEIARRHGAAVELMQLRAGVFDDAPVSVITAETVRQIERESERPVDVRRFRPNVVVRTLRQTPFEEDGWVGRVLVFGDDGPAVSITHLDERCVIINLDPDSAHADPAVLKAVVRAHDNNAGVYGTVVKCGRLSVGQKIQLK